MYKRILDLNFTLRRKSLFLLGPRQTGKSTFLRLNYPKALFVNLLNSSEFRRYSSRPHELQEVVRHHVEAGEGKIVILDEIQKLPTLLDEVQDLIEKDKSLRFILTGSSARKLKRGQANLLGGRASWYHMHPLCYPELGSKGISKWLSRLSIGALPSIVDSPAPFEDLADYVGLYLREEVAAEGLSRSIEGFSRFLDFAALTSSEQVNYSALGQDAQLSPNTVRAYYEILSDTLLGYSLPAFLQTKKRKAISTAKFYLFDCGVTNALTGRSNIPQGTSEYGKALEQAILGELKAFLDYRKIDKKIEYWRSTSQLEVDFLVYSNLKDIVAIEVKSGRNPSTRDFKGLLALEEEQKLLRKIVVCSAETPRKTAGGVEILPLENFLQQLWAGNLIPLD